MTRSGSTNPAPTAASAPLVQVALEEHGRRALARVGARMTVVYLAGAAFGVAAAAGTGPRPWWSGLGVAGTVLLLGLLAAAALAGTVAVPAGPPATVLRIVAVVVPFAALARIVAAGPELGWPQVHALAGVVVPGAGLGLALAAGPLWGFATFAALGGGFAAMAPPEASAAVPATLAGAAVTVVVAAVINVAARRGFATTEAAIRTAEAADAARLHAERRLLARRRMDRLLHDTVLSTLTLLAHGGRGVGPEQLRADCRRDLLALRSDRWSGGDEVTGSPPDAVAGAVAGTFPGPLPGALPGPRPGTTPGRGAAAGRLPRQGAPLTERLDAVRDLAARRGVDLRVHVQTGGARPEDPADRAPLDGTALEAWSSALTECVTNISRHAGVTAADVVLGGTDSTLVTLVVDEGSGFDVADVRPERLGLSGSVRDRLHDVGGRARVWSRPGQGTVVELVLPWPQPASEPLARDPRQGTEGDR